MANLHKEIEAELARARDKFPEQNVWVMLAALTEEVGELNQAILQYNEKLSSSATEDFIRNQEIKKEAVQVAVMAIRVALDCDLYFPWDNKPAT